MKIHNLQYSITPSGMPAQIMEWGRYADFGSPHSFITAFFCFL